MIQYVTRHAPELLVGYIQERSNELAMSITMLILDKEGISHCRSCPSRFGLQRVDGAYLCGAHARVEKESPRV